MKRLCNYPMVAGVAVMLALAGGIAHAADPPPAGYVSKEDYDKLLQRLDKVENQLVNIKKDTAAAQKEHDQEMDEFAAQIKVAVEKAEESHTGDTKFLVAGMRMSALMPRHAKTNFHAGFAPLFIWEFNKQIMFEAAMDVGINDDGSTSTELTFANVSYLLNDYITITGGLANVPFGQYHSHFDPPWINKLPDDPLPFGDSGIAPDNGIGLFLSGAIPIKSAKINYALYVTNGPKLITSGDGAGGPGTAGSLDFGTGSDTNNNKAVGGRIGFLPFPELEVGYSIQASKVSADTSPTAPNNVHALLQAADLNFVKQISPINGTVYLKAEWVWSSVDKATYSDATPDTGFDPVTFNNNRNGGYLTLSYRPTMVSNKYLRNTEFVVRYDRLDDINAPGGVREQRYTFGIDYWFDPRAVLKLAYECDDAKPGPNADALLVQFGGLLKKEGMNYVKS